MGRTLTSRQVFHYRRKGKPPWCPWRARRISRPSWVFHHHHRCIQQPQELPRPATRHAERLSERAPTRSFESTASYLPPVKLFLVASSVGTIALHNSSHMAPCQTGGETSCRRHGVLRQPHQALARLEQRGTLGRGERVAAYPPASTTSSTETSSALKTRACSSSGMQVNPSLRRPLRVAVGEPPMASTWRAGQVLHPKARQSSARSLAA
jgi:hypothetical protein